ncbi:MAG: hypothetical protein AAFQ84_09660 [Pseudomonadota bacterium]
MHPQTRAAAPAKPAATPPAYPAEARLPLRGPVVIQKPVVTEAPANDQTNERRANILSKRRRRHARMAAR